MLWIRPVTRSFRTSSAVILAVSVLSMLAAVAWGDIPKKISYQGRLTDSSGAPLAGSHSIVFSIYGAADGGSPLWSETKIAEADSGGVFSTVLGSANPIEIDFAGPCWLEIEVDGETLSPRREVVSVPFAYHADEADLADLADHADEADLADHADEADHADSADTAANAAEASNASMLGGRPAEAFADSSVDGHSLDAADGNPSDAVYVDNYGRVGVGTSTPSTFIDVRTAGSAEGGVSPYGEVVGHFKIDGSTAHTALSIDAQAGKDAILYLADDGEAVWDVRNDADIGNSLQVRHHSSSGGVLKPVTVDTTGHVGIATTAPNGPLHVESAININNTGATNFADRIAPVIIGDGDGTGACLLIDGNQIEQANPASDLYINYNSSGNVLVAQAGGNVGVGTSDPGAKLEVAGQVKITGGSPGEGKVLTSSSTGLATWKAITVDYYISPLKALPVFDEGEGHCSIAFDFVAHSNLDAEKTIRIPIDIPGEISGVTQKVKSLTVYYSTHNATVTRTALEYVMANGSGTSLITDSTDRSSSTYTSYTVTDATPSQIAGSLSLELRVDFEAGGSIRIGTVILTTTD